MSRGSIGLVQRCFGAWGEHSALLTLNLPVGGWLGFGEEMSCLHLEPLGSEAAFSLPAGGGSSCSAAWLGAKQGRGEHTRGSGLICHLLQVTRHSSLKHLSGLILALSALYQLHQLSRLLPQFLISLKECNLSWSQSKASAGQETTGSN